MSRLHLVLFFISISFLGVSQDNLSKYLNFAKEQYDKGDYYYALEYYEKAMQIDSNTIDILWNYAETLKAYKDYRNAEIYYAKVYDREEAQIYPASLLYWGLMQKQNGKYEQALLTFKKAKKKYYKNKKGYLYKKAKQELISTVWAASSVIDTANVSFERLPETVNTKNSEFGHGIYNGSLIFSSLRADSINSIEEVYSKSYRTHLYSSKKEDMSFVASERMKDLFVEKLNTGNGSFSLDGNRFYYSQCTEKGYNYTCKIMVAQYNNGKWFSIDSLGEIINEPYTNTTMPCIAQIGNEEVLIFASDREDGKGGLDLYLSKIRNGNQYLKVRAIKSLNSLDNEITPWWDSDNQRLYFSSSWHSGFGGYDIFYSENKNGRFEPPTNIGLPFNSSANDLYYFKQEDSSYITSNRIGVLYSKNPTCCSDIFVAKPPKKIIPPTKEESLADLNKRLPVTLYFHNDIPNPKSRDTVTTLNYMTTYAEYTKMLDKYKKEYSKGLNVEKSEGAKEDIESFFIEYVDKGVSDLSLFKKLLLKELERGAKINITVKGFASPLAKTDYNVNLTKRRISSLVNHMREDRDGVFAPYLDGTATNGGRVIFSQIPFGEYTANQLTSDNPNDVQNSIYSRSAAIERKIEIQSVSYLEENEFALVAKQPVFDAGAIKQGTTIKTSFIIKNKSNNPIEIESIRVPCDCITSKVETTKLQANEETTVYMNIDTSNLTDFIVKSVYVKLKGIDEELQLIVTSQLFK
ncbi:MAG: DUF1573 domain-containing protein [Crocinitomicaceae bacterium]|nr:DUF1573 domain-containing protein [Crocinitomicaceae bacterium]